MVVAVAAADADAAGVPLATPIATPSMANAQPQSDAASAAQQPMRCPMGSGGLRVEKQRRGGLFSAES